MNAAIDHASPAAGEPQLLAHALNVVRELTAELHPQMSGIETLDADASLERDFGLDSLARVELAMRFADAFGAALPDSAVAEADTVRDLVRALPRAHVAPPPIVPVAPPELDAAQVVPPSFATLLDALDWHAAHTPERLHVLLSDGEANLERLTFGALRAEATAVAGGLLRAGIRAGECVAIMLPTGREFFAAFYGTLCAQAVPVPLYPPARPSQIESHLRRIAGILANCEARVLLTFEGARHVAHLLRSLNTRLQTVATVEAMRVPQESLTVPRSAPGDVVFLQYTSGSTGRPKGVVLTHANVLSNLQAMQRVTGVTSTDRFVSWLPLYHDMGLIGACLGALAVGFSLVLMSPFAFLTRPVRWLRTIERHSATITAAPNFAYELCVNKIDAKELAGLDLSSLRLAFNGAEAVSPFTLQRFLERFAPYGMRREALMPVYGLAECALGLTFPPVGRGPLIDRIDRDTFLRSGVARPVERAARAPLGVVSCGAPLPGHAVRIVDAAGAPLPERMQGRIEFRGPSATSGYFESPRETARLFDGAWLDTGDLGYLTDGELYVTGRSKDIIIRGGHNIHPQELEEAIGALPEVRKGGVAVFAAHDPASRTERIVVLVETREAPTPQGHAGIVSGVNRLAVDLIGLPVDEVVLAPPRSVLKTSSGKIRRAACREAYERGELGAAARAPWVQFARLELRALSYATLHSWRRLGEILFGVRALAVGACFAPLLILAIATLPRLARRRHAARAFARLALRLAGISLRVQGPPAEVGPRVFVANHASYLDALVLTVALPAEVAFVAKQEFRRAPALGFLFRRLGCVFVARHEVLEAAGAAGELRSRLAAGESLVVFAEGTFGPDPGLLPFHMGAFMAAAAAGARVVPVAIRGTRVMLPDGARLPRPVPLDVTVGPPLAPSDGSWHDAVELRARARAHVLAHVHEPDLEQAMAAGNARPI